MSKDLPKILTWRLEWDSSLRFSGRKERSIPLSHHAPHAYIHTIMFGSISCRVETDEQMSHIQEEDDEDRIVAEGCDLDCVAKDPDLIPIEEHSGWFPDVTRDKDEVHRPEVASEDIVEEDAGYSQVKPVEAEANAEPLGAGEEWQSEVGNGRGRRDVEGRAGQSQVHDELTGICEDDHLEDQQMSTSSSAVDGKVTWRYFGDDRIHSEAEEICEENATVDDLKVTEEERCEASDQPNQVEVLVDFGGTEPTVGEPLFWQGHGFRDEVISQEEEMREQTGRHETTAAADVDADSYGEQCLNSETTMAGNGMNSSYSATDIHPAGNQMATDNCGVSSESVTFQASEQELQEDFEEEEKAYIIEEQEARYREENARLTTSSTDKENRNTLIGYEDVTELSSDVKQNGTHERIYQSQVKKAKNFLSGESESQGCMDAGPSDEFLSPGENEEEEKELPEQGSVKSLLAQWRQIEQQKRKPRATRDEAEQQQQRHRQPLSSGWSQATPEEDDEIQPTRSRVRDEILRMRSQSCDPMSSRKHSRLSPNDDDVPSVGKRVGRGRSRMEEGEEEEAEDAEHYRSQPSLTKAILAKFENLDLQAASSAIKPKSNKVIYFIIALYVRLLHC